MKDMILLDIETMDFGIESGIYEVALLVIENNKIIEEVHIAEIEDENLIYQGMGMGYKDISEDINKKEKFRDVIEKYNYPIIAHNVSFDRKFLVHYEWLDEDYICYDSIRAIKYEVPGLFSYSLEYLVSFYDIELSVTHQALDDVKMLHNIITKVQPQNWIPLYTRKPREIIEKIKTISNVDGNSNIFENKRIVFTGTSMYPRVLMKELATKCGGTITGSVSSKTDFLVCGEEPGSKLEKAQALGITVKTDESFLDDISNELDLTDAKITYTSSSNSNNQSSYEPIPEVEGKIVNIGLMPHKTQLKVEKILHEMKVKDVNKGTNSYKVDLIIHSEKEYKVLEKAKSMQTPTMSLAKFNRKILQ